jgi:hypothetical protein
MSSRSGVARRRSGACGASRDNTTLTWLFHIDHTVDLFDKRDFAD